MYYCLKRAVWKVQHWHYCLPLLYERCKTLTIVYHCCLKGPWFILLFIITIALLKVNNSKSLQRMLSFTIAIWGRQHYFFVYHYILRDSYYCLSLISRRCSIHIIIQNYCLKDAVFTLLSIIIVLKMQNSHYCPPLLSERCSIHTIIHYRFMKDAALALLSTINMPTAQSLLCSLQSPLEP